MILVLPTFNDRINCTRMLALENEENDQCKYENTTLKKDNNMRVGSISIAGTK